MDHAHPTPRWGGPPRPRSRRPTCPPLQQQPGSSAPTVPAEDQGRFKRLDSNHDGQLSLQEFGRASDKKKHLRFAAARRIVNVAHAAKGCGACAADQYCDGDCASVRHWQRARGRRFLTAGAAKACD